jgi:phosphatidate cytidylyltransferase
VIKPGIAAMFKQRVITAVIIAVIFFALLLNLSAVDFLLVICLMLFIAGWEWSNLMKVTSVAGKSIFLSVLTLSLAAASVWLGLFDTFDHQRAEQISLAAVALWAIIFLWVQGYPSSAILWSSRTILGALGILLLTFTWVAAAAILHNVLGQWLLLLAIVIVVLADVGGYFVGTLAGRHKLAPLVSPGKTWEGFAGGLLLQFILIGVLLWTLPDIATTSSLLILVIPVALYSVLGDLFESMVKRHSGVKDSSQLLPGHGGVLDRIDGIMAALPLFSLLLSLTRPF